MFEDLRRKTAIVTGASGGLGLQFAQVLAEAGCVVILAARRRDKLEAAVAQITASGGVAQAMSLDVTDDDSVAQVAEGFALEQNYPNPFNPTTTVLFSLPAAGEASLDVIDVRGHVVRTLHRGDLGAGEHRLVWDGADDRGRVAPSGVYFARLRHDGGELSHKMLLTK